MWRQLFSDKNGCVSMRELATAIFVLVILISWVAALFFGIQVPEFMFYSFVSLVAAGCFGYSFERKQTKKQFHEKND